MEKMINVALIGQGRSGRDIHGVYFLGEKSKAHFRVVAVVETDESRRARAKAEFGCDVYADYRELFGRNDIDLVVNATPSYLHYPITLDLLKHKFNVLVEKPFSKYAMECEEMIRAARENGVMLAVFQQSRFAPYYERTKRLIESGVLGNIKQIHLNFSGYSRRWDWQCSQRCYGGALLNTGPHPMDMAVDLLGLETMPNVFSVMQQINIAGDAEDYARVILTAPGKPLVDVEINPADKYAGYNIKVCGDRGTLCATTTQVKWQVFADTPLPELVLKPLTKADGISPSYCSEKLQWQESCEEMDGTAFDVGTHKLYEDVYAHLVQGKPLTVRLEQVLQQIRIIELAHAQNPIPVRFSTEK